MMTFGLIMTVVIIASVLGDFFVKQGTDDLKNVDTSILASIHGIGDLGKLLEFVKSSGICKNPRLMGGIGLLTIHFIAFMMAMKLAPVTVVVPLMACTYVGTALLGKFFLHEKVTLQRWGGIAVIMMGVGLLGLSTLHPPRPAHGERGPKAAIQTLQNKLTSTYVLPKTEHGALMPRGKKAPSKGP